jgi:catechol 2,3-dioxygenase-like lactoylglutathione lyase family enzyme
MLTRKQEARAMTISPVKRTTIFCRDIEASLAIYRDVLGLEIIEDKTIGGPAMAKMIQLDDVKMRIVHLRAPGGPDAGLIGLYCVLEPHIPVAPRPPEGVLHYGQAAVVFSSDRGDEIAEELKRRGAKFLTPPTQYRQEQDRAYMKAGVYTEMIFYDPDGLLVSVMGYKPL